MYRQALKIDPNHFDAGLHLASAYLQTAAFQNAYAVASDLYRRAPADPKAVVSLAAAQIGCGRPALALEFLDKADGLPQTMPFEVYFYKGVAHRHLNETEEAIAWYRKAEQLKPADPPLLFNLAVALDQLGDYAQAVIYYRNYLRESKDEQGAETRKKVVARIRALRADLSAFPDEERTR